MMDPEKERIAREAGIIAVEHDVVTTWSDRRAPERHTSSHNAAWDCPLCTTAKQTMLVLASTSGGEK